MEELERGRMLPAAGEVHVQEQMKPVMRMMRMMRMRMLHKHGVLRWKNDVSSTSR